MNESERKTVETYNRICNTEGITDYTKEVLAHTSEAFAVIFLDGLTAEELNAWALETEKNL